MHAIDKSGIFSYFLGDGRNDSPGYSAKFLTYTLMEHDSYTILDLQIVDKREVGRKSPNMEKEGLAKCLAAVEEAGITITELVTDAHRQIACWMRKCFLLLIVNRSCDSQISV